MCVSSSIRQGSDLARLKAGFVDITCCDQSQFRAWTTDKVFRAVDVLEAGHRRVQEGAMTKGTYNDMELSTGLNRNSLGVLACRSLRSECLQRSGLTLLRSFFSHSVSHRPPHKGDSRWRLSWASKVALRCTMRYLRLGAHIVAAWGVEHRDRGLDLTECSSRDQPRNAPSILEGRDVGLPPRQGSEAEGLAPHFRRAQSFREGARQVAMHVHGALGCIRDVEVSSKTP